MRKLFSFKLLTIFLLLIFGRITIFGLAQNFRFFQPPPAEEYAPNFWFDSEEKYFPTDPLDFYYQNGEEIPGAEAVAKYDNLSLNEKLSHFKVFYTIKDLGNEWVYEYWLFYVMNSFDNGHWGDWESVFVFVDKINKKIIRVNGSAHRSSNEINFSQQISNHIWVYVGLGSHANCPDEPMDQRCDFTLWNARENWDGKGKRVLNGKYLLTNLNEKFIQTFKEQKSFNKKKSSTLGVDFYKILKLKELNIPNPKKDIYVNVPILCHFFCETPNFPWHKAEYNNPEKIRPWSVARVKEKFNDAFVWLGNKTFELEKFVKKRFEKGEGLKKEILRLFLLIKGSEHQTLNC